MFVKKKGNFMTDQPIKIQQIAINHLINKYKVILDSDIYSVNPHPSKYYAENLHHRATDSLISSSYLISRVPEEYSIMKKKCEPIVQELNELFEGALIFYMAVENNYLVIKDRKIKPFIVI